MAAYDYAIVGSSPLLLIKALLLRRKGHSVVLFEQDRQLGGAWKLGAVDSIGQIECACHLLEWQLGGYEKLEDLIGLKTVQLEPAPFRLFQDGKVEPYTSRLGLLKGLWREKMALIRSVLKLVLFPLKYKRHDQGRITSRWQSLVHFMRFRAPGIILFDGIRKPKHGFTGFIQALDAQVRDAGVTIIHAQVTNICVKRRILEFDSQQKLGFGKLVVGESLRVQDDNLLSRDRSLDHYHAVIFFEANHLLKLCDYVHFADDPFIHRITFCRYAVIKNSDCSVFLCQTRKRIDVARDITRIQSAFYRAGLIAPGKGIFVVEQFEESYPDPSNTIMTRDGAEDCVEVVRTYGDLMRNLVQFKA